MRTLVVLFFSVLVGSVALQAQEQRSSRPRFEAMAAASYSVATPQSAGQSSASSSRVVQDLSGRSWLVIEPPFLDESHIKSAGLAPNPSGLPGFPKYALRLSLTLEGQRLLREASAGMVGKHMAMLVNGRLASVALVRAELNSHALELSTNAFSDQELEELSHAF